jgi:hypothetical protein
MAHVFTDAISRVKGGINIDDWFVIISNTKGFNDGGLVPVTDFTGNEKLIPRNRGVLVFRDRECLQKGVAGKNYGNGGSNSVTGNPIAFMDSKEVCVDAFKNKLIIQGEKGDFFLIPLTNLYECPLLVDYYAAMTAQYLTGLRGGNAFSIENIATALSGVLSSIFYHLSREITLNGKKPNSKRIFFLVDAIREMSIVAQNAAKYSSDIRKVFEVMPFATNSADILQSIIMCFLFDKKPCESILINWVGLILKRYRRYSGGNARFSDPQTPANGIYACMLVPMIADLIASDLDNKEIIENIAKAINTAINKTAEAIVANQGLPVDKENKLILTFFGAVSSVKLVKDALLPQIYDCVVSGRKDNFAQHMGLSVKPFFISPGTLNMSGKKLPTDAILVLQDKNKKYAMFAPGNVHDWTAVSFIKGLQGKAEFANMGPGDFKSGNTLGQTKVANGRFTAGRDLMGPGFSLSRMQCNRLGKRFTPMARNIQFTSTKPFIFDCTLDGIYILQDGVVLCHLTPDDGEEACDMQLTVGFKYCKVSFEILREGFPKPILAPQSELKESMPPPYEDAIVGPDVPDALDGAPVVISLADRIAQIRLTRPKPAFSKKTSSSFKDPTEDLFKNGVPEDLFKNGVPEDLVKNGVPEDLFKNGVPEGFPFHDE